MIAIHLRDVLPDGAKQGVQFMEKLHCTVDRQECQGKTCGAEGNPSILNLALEVLQNEKCLVKLGLTKRDLKARFEIRVCGDSMRVIVPLPKGQFRVTKKGKKVDFLDFQIGNLMNRNIFGGVPRIERLAKKTAKENKNFPKWENTIQSCADPRQDNAGAKVKALNNTMVACIEACRSLFPQKTATQKFEDGNQSIACNFMRKCNDKIAMHKDTPSEFPCALVNNTKDHASGGELFLAEAAFTSNYIDGDVVILDGESLHGIYPCQANTTRFSMVIYNNGEKKKGEKEEEEEES